MNVIARSIEINAPRSKVWSVVSDIDNEPEYWHGTREVINHRRDGNVTERTIVQNFMGTRVDQRVTLNPEESVEVEYLKGTTRGRKRVMVEGRDSLQLVRITWEVRFTGLLRLISPVIRDHVTKGTENALVRIKDAAEGRGATQPLG